MCRHEADCALYHPISIVIFWCAPCSSGYRCGYLISSQQLLWFWWKNAAVCISESVKNGSVLGHYVNVISIYMTCLSTRYHTTLQIDVKCTTTTPWWVYYWLDVMGCHEYKGDFAKTFINFVSPANIIKWNCRQRSLLLASLRSSSLPRLVAGNVKYFCLLKINVDSPSDICFSRLLWTWPRNLMQELSILYLYNILLYGK